ncbi:hypothetical protein COU20_01095 [Candidatus Kaiserbacteria bacterium CG10_big_fil_rev_8_21_14_0_10_59_10]|uniref:Uncharacterized protein n=1 Tax=Candidatus Kaiserbacteria bacterium CG10_big_fil_rev_8_21_14_0_10_59_10 TaxID=1974612 RepID=A0A2H0U8I7_9BACT|nr:MAG: hypothetical protein COU20_01095 [Candidatus Kaiserbacteria bacterium CG10_big_fil_rev_8_21_14_0_10_59_10]
MSNGTFFRVFAFASVALLVLAVILERRRRSYRLAQETLLQIKLECILLEQFLQRFGLEELHRHREAREVLTRLSDSLEHLLEFCDEDIRPEGERLVRTLRALRAPPAPSTVVRH